LIIGIGAREERDSFLLTRIEWQVWHTRWNVEELASANHQVVLKLVTIAQLDFSIDDVGGCLVLGV
jgi:hypothetical protein